MQSVSEPTYTKQEFTSYFRRLRWLHLLVRWTPSNRPVNVRNPASLNQYLDAFTAALGPLPSARKHAVPKRVFMLWLQGWDDAPEIVKASANSFERHNPDWEIVRLSEVDLPNWLPEYQEVARPDLPRTSRADIARVGLLQRHGGIWADATLWCSRPLDDWLGAAMLSDMFMFYKPRGFRLIDNWFIAAPERSASMNAFWNIIVQYWNYFDRPHRYFWPHYLFELLIARDPVAKSGFDSMPKAPAAPCFVVNHNAFRSPSPDFVTRFNAESGVPLQKLNHKWLRKQVPPDTPLAQLTGLKRL